MPEIRDYAPPTRTPIRVAEAPAVRGERIFVGHRNGRPESFTYGLRAWSEVRSGTWADIPVKAGCSHANPSGEIDLVEFVHEEDWFAYLNLGALPSFVGMWPADEAWVE
jgi:hypothetical protein